MLGLIDEGLVPLPSVEGDYMPRLEIIRDMPRGKVIWHFEIMDMARAKEVLGENSCIALYPDAPDSARPQSFGRG